MSDEDREIKEMLDRKAREVKPRTEIPPALRGRVRRRIALNSVAVVAAVLFVGAAAFAGIRSLTGGPEASLVGQPSGSVQTTPPTSAAPTACTSSQLSAVAALGGAAGSRGGSIVLTDNSQDACTLQGPATLTLIDQSGQPITTGVVFSKAQANWQANNLPEPAGWPVVTVAPNGTASIRLNWTNWCPDGRAIPQWEVQIPGSGALEVTGLDSAGGPPPCLGRGESSDIAVGPFEPGSGS